MQTVLITGANGFVSWYLIRNLLQRDFTVIATGKGPSRLPFKNDNLHYHTMDFTNRNDVSTIMEQFQPDIVVHAGAMSKPDDCEKNKAAAFLTNVTGTEYLLQAAEKYKSYFLFVSTDFVFEGNNLQYKENDPLNPVNYYGETKMAAEAAVAAYTHSWSIVRTILVFGKPMSGRQNILKLVASGLEKGESLKIFDDQTRMPTYVEDLAIALMTMIEKKAQGVFHISGGDVTTPYQMALSVAALLGYDSQKIEAVTKVTFHQPAVRPPTTGFDLTKAKTELAYHPTPLEEGLRKTFDVETKP